MTPLRVVSLLPSATEIVASLGFGDALVGRSHECDFPPGVERLPVCTAPKLDASGSTEEIHQQVEELVSRGLSVYRVDAELLRDLSPTHVVTQVQCEVCAVSLADVEQALARFLAPRPLLIPLNPTSLEDVFEDIARVAAGLGSPQRGKELSTQLRGRFHEVAWKAKSSAVRPRVATVEWLSPLMAAGNWIPELVEMAGGVNLFGQSGRHSPWLSWEQLRAADPDRIVLFPCGFSLERLRSEFDLVTRLPGWNALSAARSRQVFLAEGNQLFNRPGPRLVETLEALAEMLHPELFLFGLEGSAWERL
jgi:iron complex transport system substrate-binding protein